MLHRICTWAPIAALAIACADPLRPADVPADLVAARATNGISIIDLGVAAGAGSVAKDVNAGGVIVGYATTRKYEPDSYYHAMRWTADAGGAVTQENLMSRLGLPAIADAMALAVNDAGMIVGGMRTSDQENYHGFVLSAAAVIDVQSYPRCDGVADDRNYSFARDINNRDQVVGEKGYAPNPSNRPGYFFYLDLQAATPCLDQLPGLATGGAAYAINDSSVIAGESTEGIVNWAVQYRRISGAWTAMKLGRDSTRAWAINTRGDIAGQFNGPKSNVDQHALVWRNSAGALVEREPGTLGGPQSVANGIDDAGRVVGWAHNKQWNMHAFDWTETAGMRDLGTLGGKRSSASAVNGRNIVGDSEIATLGTEIVNHATLWRLP